MNQLFINNKELQLSEQTKIGVTYCANDIGELQNRQGVFSNIFKIPNNKYNSEVLEWSNLLTSSSNLPYLKNYATYIEDGVEIVSEGDIFFENADDDFYYLSVISGNIDLLSAIGDVTVGELYKDDIMYDWSLNNAFASRYGNDYFIYPLIDWRKDIDTFFTTSTIDVREMLPCAMISGIFDRLSDYTGFTFTGSYLNSSDHKSMILTPNNLTKVADEAIFTSQRDIVPSDISTGIITGAYIPSGTATSSVLFYPDFKNENNESEFAFGDFRPSINKIGSLHFAGDYQIKWEPTGSNVNENTKSCWIVARFKDDLGVTINQLSFQGYTKSKTDTNISPIINIDIESPEMTFLSTRQYHIELEVYLEQKNIPMYFNFHDYEVFEGTGNPIGWFDIVPPPLEHVLTFNNTDKIAFGSPINFENLFTMKAKDVLKDILLLRGLIIQTNNYKKEIKFTEFEDLNRNLQVAKKWSDKWQNETNNVSFQFGNYAQKNWLKFKLDSDKDNNVDKQFDAYFTIDNGNLDIEKTVVQLSHPATMMFNRYLNYPILQVRQLEDANNGFLKNDWRLLNLIKQNTPFDVTFTDGTSTGTSSESIPFCKFKGFDVLFWDYYNLIYEILQKTKVLNCIIKLTPIDITEIDFSIPIYLNIPSKSIDGNFYLNKISNYKGGKTAVELIRL